MDRRKFLGITSAALTLMPALARADIAASGGLRLAATQAWLWGLPLIEMAQQRSARAADGVAGNQFQHQRVLISAKDQFVTTPNNDTLYSQAWLNLEKGPVTISLPESGGRYNSLALMDMYTNNFAVLGTRTTGDGPQTFHIFGPKQASDDPRAIRAPTNTVWALGRTLVDGEADLPAAHAFQDGWKIAGPKVAAPKTYAKRNAAWDAYFDAVQALMNESPPPATDGRVLERISPLLRFGGRFDANRYAAGQIAEIRDGIADALRLMAQARARSAVRNGWSFPLYGLGDFGQDYTYRALIAVGGLAALPRVEAMYLRAAGPNGAGFDADKAWTLTFAADQLPPVDAFWSLSMYRQTADGQLFFAENPINRYAIGDRTADLKRGADGSLSIWMSRGQPPAGTQANWLPAPADGKFVVILRAYLPKPALIEARYQPPAIQPA